MVKSQNIESDIADIDISNGSLVGDEQTALLGLLLREIDERSREKLLRHYSIKNSKKNRRYAFSKEDNDAIASGIEDRVSAKEMAKLIPHTAASIKTHIYSVPLLTLLYDIKRLSAVSAITGYGEKTRFLRRSADAMERCVKRGMSINAIAKCIGVSAITVNKVLTETGKLHYSLRDSDAERIACMCMVGGLASDDVKIEYQVPLGKTGLGVVAGKYSADVVVSSVAEPDKYVVVMFDSYAFHHGVKKSEQENRINKMISDAGHQVIRFRDKKLSDNSENGFDKDVAITDAKVFSVDFDNLSRFDQSNGDVVFAKEMNECICTIGSYLGCCHTPAIDNMLLASFVAYETEEDYHEDCVRAEKILKQNYHKKATRALDRALKYKHTHEEDMAYAIQAVKNNSVDS